MSRRPRPIRGGWVAAIGLPLFVAAACGASTSPGIPGTSSVPVPTASVPAGAGASHQDGVPLEDAGLPTLLPEAVLLRVPTRVVIEELGIDLPVVAPAGDTSGRFPFCDVAEFLPAMSRPGRPGTTFLFAHAREGMFLPILEASRIGDGRSMLGLRVVVFTSDDRRFLYEVEEVQRHVMSLEPAYLATAEQLVLQTSEGAHGTPGKTMLLARPVDERAASHAEAHPEARPVACS